MALFNLFRRKKTEVQVSPAASPVPINGNTVNEPEPPRVPKSVFIEENAPDFQSLTFKSNGQKIGIDLVYDFLQVDYERKGYEDALTNPDESYKNDNINLLRMDLAILVQKVDNYYTEILKELDFHIESRKRSGLVDLVLQLNSKREVVVDQMERLNAIKFDIEQKNGITQRIVLSYQRGFLRGLAALSHSSVMNRKL
ncbi:MAG: hypothetical protein AB1777_09225 [Bacteroidota bacterium]